MFSKPVFCAVLLFFGGKIVKKTIGALLLLLMFVSMFLVGCNGNPFEGSHVVSFNPNNGDETINILVKNDHKAKAPSMAYNDDGLPFMEWRTSDGKAFDLETSITKDMELAAAYYQKMTPEADFEYQCIISISSGFYFGVYNHLKELIDAEKLLKPVNPDDASFVFYQGENITQIEYVLSNLQNLSATQHFLEILFTSEGALDEVTVEYSNAPETFEVLTLDIDGTTYAFSPYLNLFDDTYFEGAIGKRGWKPFTDLEDKITYEGMVGKLYYVDRKIPGKPYDDMETMRMENLDLKIHVKPNDKTLNYEINVDASSCESLIDVDNAHDEHSRTWSLSLDDEQKPPVKAKTYYAVGSRYKYESFYKSFYDVEEFTIIM